jgi:GMP synthase (glutamine-hydrolysing)
MKTITTVTPQILEELRAEMALRRTNKVFVFMSLGSQFAHLIPQALAKLGVFVVNADPASIMADDIKQIGPIGIILSGGPGSMVDEPPPFDEKILALGIPTFGICLGFQLLAKYAGATVRHGGKGEFNTYRLTNVDVRSPLLMGCNEGDLVLQSHGDVIDVAPTLAVIASTECCPVAAGEAGHLYGVQFHPEVVDTKCGMQIFRNFCFDICEARDIFPAQKVAENKIVELSQKLAGKTVVLALSGGCDSSIVAHLLKRACELQPFTIHAIYIKGIDRIRDEQYVRDNFDGQPWLTLTTIDATEEFLWVLRGLTKMDDKRLAMIHVYRAFLEWMIEETGADCIAQGTLNTDEAESGGGVETGARRAMIKRHHNVHLNFSVDEVKPLVDQVKDTARNIGEAIGVPHTLLYRHPFPGPGLVVRIDEEITETKLAISRQATQILDEEIERFKLGGEVWQYGPFVTDVLHTCSKGDDAKSGIILLWWAVTSVDGFTAQPADLPFTFHRRVAQRCEGEIKEVGAVFYRFSGKPVATIEAG